MNIKTAVLSLSIAVALSGITSMYGAVAGEKIATPAPSSQANDSMDEADVRVLLAGEGFTEINDVKFKEGTWSADAESADGRHVELRVDSATRRIYPDEPVATIGKDAIITKLLDAGYSNVHDVEMEGGVWKAEANDSNRNDVEIKLDPEDGHILGSEKDIVGGNH
jgi:hypothetical protein